MKKRITIPLIIPLIITAMVAGFFAHKTVHPKTTFNELLAADGFADFNDPFDKPPLSFGENDAVEFDFQTTQYNELLQEYNELVESKNRVIGIAEELIEENKTLTRQRNHWRDVANIPATTPPPEEPLPPSLAEQNLMLLDEQNYLIHQQNMILDDIYHNSF